MNDVDQLIGRRVNRRQSVRISGRLLSACREQPVMIEDLSSTGARVVLWKSISSSKALLMWEGRKEWCEVMWCDGVTVGLRFRDIQDVA